MDKKAKIEGVEGRIKYQFQNQLLIWEALQAPGSSVQLIGDRRIVDGNKRLAVFGNIALLMALGVDWIGGGEPKGIARLLTLMEILAQKNVGRFDQIRQEVASNANLNRVGRLHGIDQYINKNPSQRGAVPPGLMADTVEAILGAVWLDSDLKSVKRVMTTLGLVPT